MYTVKGKLQDGTTFKFETAAEQLGGAAQDFVAALAAQENTSPVERVTFIQSANNASLKLKKAGDKKPKADKKKGSK